MKNSLLAVGAAVATVFGIGYAPIAPGTAGSLVSAGLFLAVRNTTVNPWLLCGCFLLLGYFGSYAGRKLWGDDPSRVVIDEFAGCWIACLAVPSTWGITGILSAFLLFRIFDIFKPWPVCIFDRMKSASGILLDDVAAGIIAGIIIQLGSALHGAL